MAYPGRRAPNVSAYLANLNTIPSNVPEIPRNDITISDDGLEFLTNTEFFDFDHFNTDVNFNQQAQDVHQKAGSQFAFNDFQHYPNTSSGTSPSTLPPSPQNMLHGNYPPQPQHFAPSPGVGDKRKASIALPTTADLEETSRLAAEEDKRRRNTAASARFRVKKKQREQALEKQAKEMTDKVQQLEGKVQQLEMENKWLKELITEKSDVKGIEAALIEKKAARALEKESEERSTENHTDGVGTEEDEEDEDDEESFKVEV